MKLIVPIIWNAANVALVKATVRLNIGPNAWITTMTDETGMAALAVDPTLGATQFEVYACGYKSLGVHVDLGVGDKQIRVGMPADLARPQDIILPAMEADRNAFPSYPTREQVANVLCGFQGITNHYREFGSVPAFGPETSSLADDDLVAHCRQMKALGLTHVEFDISWQYVEPGYSFWCPGRDLTQNLAEVCRRIDIIVREGMFVKLALSGDGLSKKDAAGNYIYNDPQGWTWGYEWLMENLGRILNTLKAYPAGDLLRFCAVVPGYDGVFYGWGREGEVPDQQPARVLNYGNTCRRICPESYYVFGIEHTPGNIPVGEGADEWRVGDRMDWCDFLASEYNPFDLKSDSTFQIIARMTRPYNRPPGQVGDPNPPFYLVDCSRGKRFYIVYEILTYLWVRNEVTLEQCNAWYDYFRAMAPSATICMVKQ